MKTRIFLAAILLPVALLVGCSNEPTKPKTNPSPEASSKDSESQEAEIKKDTPKVETPEKKEASEAKPEAKVEPAAKPEKPAAPMNTSSEEGTPKEEVSTDAPKTEKVLLGQSELFAGIPGKGELKIEEIQAWLDDEKNHVVIEPELPLGMSKGAGQIKIPADNPLTRAKIELGRQLYFDTRLSKDNTVSCASCHDPEHGYAFDSQFGIGILKQLGNRNSPVAFNRILSDKQFWDGRAATLEEQAVGPIQNPIEMGNTHEVATLSIAGIEGYRVQFEKIFGESGVTIDNVAKAIASFERAIVTGPTPYDYYDQLTSLEKIYGDDLQYLEEDDPEAFEKYKQIRKDSEEHPMAESAIRGAKLFFSDKTNCTACHVGANFSDELYHNLGVGMDAAEPDLGLFVETKEEKDKGAFKTPTVRNVSQTGPYMHDGSQKTLEEVVEWYDKGGHPNEHLDEKIKPLKLTDEEKKDLVDFMIALTGELPKVEQGRLPK